MTTRGKFITFEGPEGGGKSTQIRRLAARLEEAGHHILVTREPGGTPTGEAIRQILQHDAVGEPISPETELLLFEASRAQLVSHVIGPALEKGVWVLCDRFMDSTTAYQGYGRGFDVETVLAINRLAVAGCEPDLTVLLDIETQKGLIRLEGRNRRDKTGRDRIEREERAFHERVRAGFLQLAHKWPERIRIVDAMRAEEEVEAMVWDLVCGALKP